MPSIATPGDVAVYLDAADQTLPTDRVTQALNSAEAAVRAEIGWDPVQSVRVYAISEPTRTVLLPAMNVTALTVTIGGIAYTTLTWTAHGIVRFNSQVLGGTITYTAGWPAGDRELDGIRAAVVELAVSKLDNPRNLRTWSLGDESETYMGSTAQNPLASDPRLAPYRLPVLA